MNLFLLRFFQLVMVGCFFAALCEVDWVIIVAVFTTSFPGLLTVGTIQGTADNDAYEAVVLEYRSPDDPPERIQLFRPIRNLLFLAAFASMAGLAIWQDNQWFLFVPFAIVFVLAVAISFRRRTQREQIWNDFAQQNGLDFHPGNLWNPLDTPSVAGVFDGCELKLGTSWQSNPHSRLSSQVLIGSAVVTAPGAEFCVDDLEVEASTSELATQLFEFQHLSRPLRATPLKRIALFEEQVSLHASRVPRTIVELRFWCELLKDVCKATEQSLNRSPPNE